MSDPADLVTLRRELHQIPEVGLDLPQTQARLLRELDGLPLEVHTGQALSSITAVLRGTAPTPAGQQRKTVLLRADMDALPVVEATGLPWASTNGAMHACGHDLHMAMLVGAVRTLCQRRDELPGDVLFMFQPGEEGDDGARHMLDEGLLAAAGRRPDAAFALHVWASQLAPAVIAGRAGTIMSASATLDVRVLGRGGHGSAPHLAADPVPAMAEMVTGLQVLLARHFDLFDPALITVGRVRAGEVRNVIPDEASFEATVRSFSPEASERLFTLVPQLLHGIATAHGVEVEVDLQQGYPATRNDQAATDLARSCVADLFGPDRWHELPHSMTASEDFSRVLDEVPGAFLLLSAVPAGADPQSLPNNHSPLAHYDDAVLDDGAALLVELALRSLSAVQSE